jgi:hypothetical protein
MHLQTLLHCDQLTSHPFPPLCSPLLCPLLLLQGPSDEVEVRLPPFPNKGLGVGVGVGGQVFNSRIEPGRIRTKTSQTSSPSGTLVGCVGSVNTSRRNSFNDMGAFKGVKPGQSVVPVSRNR